MSGANQPETSGPRRFQPILRLGENRHLVALPILPHSWFWKKVSHSETKHSAWRFDWRSFYACLPFGDETKKNDSHVPFFLFHFQKHVLRQKFSTCWPPNWNWNRNKFFCQNSLTSPRSGQKYRSSPSLIPPSIVFFRTDVELHHVPNDADFGWNCFWPIND